MNWRQSYNKKSLLLVYLNQYQHSYHQTSSHPFYLPWKGFLGISEKPWSKNSALSTVSVSMLSMLFLSLISQICILLLHAFWWFYISITFDFLFVFLQSNPFVLCIFLLGLTSGQGEQNENWNWFFGKWKQV